MTNGEYQQLIELLGRRFAGVDQRFDAVDRRFEGVDARLDTIDRRFETIDGRLDSMDRRFESIEGRFGVETAFLLAEPLHVQLRDGTARPYLRDAGAGP